MAGLSVETLYHQHFNKFSISPFSLMSDRRQRSAEEQIDDLAVQLESITKQLTALRLQVRKERQESARRTSLDRTDLRIGDRVEITNGYQNLRGTTGVVIRLSTTFVTIRTDEGQEITRGTQNIKRVEE